MKQRLDLLKIFPQALKPLLDLENLLSKTPLSIIQKELIKIRASQINGCAYCLNMHNQDALKHGEDAKRLYVISAWREARNWFDEKEQIILQLTEEVTQISNHGVSDATYEKAVALLGEETTAHVIMNIVAINTWNRVAITLHKHPE